MLKIACATLLALTAVVGTLPDTALAAGATPAAAPTAAYLRMQRTLIAMGYNPQPQGKIMSVPVTNKYSVYVLPSDTGALFWITLTGWSKASEGRAPLGRALDYNDNHMTYLSKTQYTDGTYGFAMNFYLTGPADAANIAKSIDLVESAVVSTRPIWNPTLWK